MKFRNLYSLVFTLLISLNLNGQQNVEKTLVKAFNLAGNNVVLIDASHENEVVVTEWSHEQMRVVINVSLGNGSDQMLNSLVKVGRYNLDSAIEEGRLRIFLPGLERDVKLRSGGELIEIIDFEIFVPSNITVQTNAVESVAEKTVSSF